MHQFNECLTTEIIMATQSRSGSQFLVDLVTTACGASRMYPQSRINGARVDTMREGHQRTELQSLINLNRYVGGYFTKYKIKAIKVEEPSVKKLGHDMVAALPNAKWLFSLRKIEDIVTSHHNIKSWGYDEAKVMRLWRANLQFYEFIENNEKPLFVIDVSNPYNNDLDKFCTFLSAQKTTTLEDKFNQWSIINPLSRQQELHNEQKTEKKIPPNLHTLRQRYDWADGIERRYSRLFERCTNKV